MLINYPTLGIPKTLRIITDHYSIWKNIPTEISPPVNWINAFTIPTQRGNNSDLHGKTYLTHMTSYLHDWKCEEIWYSIFPGLQTTVFWHTHFCKSIQLLHVSDEFSGIKPLLCLTHQTLYHIIHSEWLRQSKKKKKW